MNLRWREYAKLPTSDVLNSKIPESNILSFLGLRLQVPKRYSRLLLGLLIALGFFYFFATGFLRRRDHSHQYSYPQVLLTAPSYSGLPPLYEAYVEYENSLPQQLQDDNLAERKYIYMGNHVYGVGWNNVLQDMIYSALVASESGRGFVWYNYTWNRDGPEYSDYNGKKIPSHVPISTMLSGYILGLDSGNRGANITRPIPQDLYERICPLEERVYIDEVSVEALRQLDPANAGTSLGDIPGKAILAAWLDRLNQPDTKDARCVEVRKNTRPLFDYLITGSKKVQELWDLLAKSPMIAGWSWSPLVYEAFERSRDVISPITPSFIGFDTSNETDTLPLLALHLRRGDYSQHCLGMAGWGSSYTGQNSYPEFEERDKFIVPQVVEGHSSSDLDSADTLIVSSQDERVKYYTKHCYPDIGEVVERVRQVVHDYESFARDRLTKGSQKYENWGSTTRQKRRSVDRESVGNKLLKRVYIMSNGDRQLLLELKQALMDDAERSKLSNGETNDWEFEWTWEGVSTSRDLDLGWEEKPVGQALDMYVGQRSEVFIGNGFSSMTSNIVLLRMKDGRDPMQIRFF